MALPLQAARIAAPAISEISRAIYGILRRSKSAKAVALRAQLDKETQYLRLQLSTLCCELDSTATEDLSSEPSLMTNLDQLAQAFEDILDQKYVDEIEINREAIGGETAYPLVRRVGAILKEKRSSFAMELAIKAPASGNLLRLKPILEKYNDSVDDLVEDDDDQAIEDSSIVKQSLTWCLRDDALTIKAMVNNLHGTLHEHWPCPEMAHRNDNVDGEITLGQCDEAYVELDSRWILPSESPNNFFVILKGNGMDQLCELHYVDDDLHTKCQDCFCQTPYTWTQEYCLFLHFDDKRGLWDDSKRALPRQNRLWVVREDSLTFKFGLISLKELSSNTKFSFELVKKIEILVARAVLVLIDGPWMCDERDLSLDTVFISCEVEDDNSHLLNPSLAQVFIRTRFGQMARAPKKAYGKPAHAFPVIRALGELIADMEKALQKISISLTCSTSLQRALEILKAMQKQRGPAAGICKVIKFCLDKDSTKHYPADSLHNPDFIVFLYERIVRELEMDYVNSADMTMTPIYQIGTPRPAADHHVMGNKRRRIACNTQRSVHILEALDEEESSDVHHIMSPSSTGLRANTKDSMETRSAQIAAVDRRPADGWFSKLKGVHEILLHAKERKLTDEGKPDVNEDEVDGLIKVALLDTGVDMTHPVFQKYRENHQLHEPESLNLIDQENQSGMIDLDGHGTHMCHTLLRTAPFTKVYPIRVFKDQHTLEQDNGGGSASLIAKAVRHAVMAWNVDIIIMSFDVSDEEEKIEDAITYAQREHRVLVFAAASNDNALRNEPIGFPARCSDSVICINSSTASDMRSSFSPPGVDGQANLSVVGEGIWAAWSQHCPEQKSGHVYKTLSGTSSATVIAAGVAALILDFSRQAGLDLNVADLRYWERLRDKLGETQNMRTVIRTCMTHKRTGGEYNFIRPWVLFESPDLAKAAMEIIRTLRRRFRSPEYM